MKEAEASKRKHSGAGEDFAAVSDIMVAAMAGFGLKAKDMAHIADVLASAANASAISITDIGYSLKYVAPVARSAGVSLEQVSAALAILGNAGIKAEQAGTTLRMALIRLADPPKEAAKMMDQLGIKTTDASGKMLPLGQIIAQLHEKFKGLSQAQQVQAAATIFGAESMSGMMTLIQAGPATLEKLTQAFIKSDGAARAMAKGMTDNLAGALEEMRGALESTMISIGDALAPAIRTIAEVLKGVIEAFNKLSEPVKKGLAIFGGLVAALTVVVGVSLTFIGIVFQGIAALSSFGAAIGGLSGILTALTGPVGLVTAAIMGLVTVGVLVYKKWDEVKVFLIRAWQTISDTALRVWGGIRQFFADIGSRLAAAVGSGILRIPQYFINLRDRVLSILAGWVRMMLDLGRRLEC